MNVLEMINEFNIIVKKIPNEIEMTYFLADDETVENEEVFHFKPSLEYFKKKAEIENLDYTDEDILNFYNNFYKIYENGQRYYIKKFKNKNSGKYIAIDGNSNHNVIDFNNNVQFIADTIDEAVSNCVEYIKEKRQIELELKSLCN